MTLYNPFKYYILVYIQVYLCEYTHIWWGFPGGISGKEATCHCRRRKRCGFDPWVRRSHGAEHNNPLQFSCLENPTGREAWLITVHRVIKSWTWLKQLSTAQHIHIWYYDYINIHYIYYSENKVIMFLPQFGWETHPF